MQSYYIISPISYFSFINNTGNTRQENIALAKLCLFLLGYFSAVSTEKCDLFFHSMKSSSNFVNPSSMGMVS